MGEPSWSEAVAGLTERALLDSFPHQVKPNIVVCIVFTDLSCRSKPASH